MMTLTNVLALMGGAGAKTAACFSKRSINNGHITGSVRGSAVPCGSWHRAHRTWPFRLWWPVCRTCSIPTGRTTWWMGHDDGSPRRSVDLHRIWSRRGSCDNRRTIGIGLCFGSSAYAVGIFCNARFRLVGRTVYSNWPVQWEYCGFCGIP